MTEAIPTLEAAIAASTGSARAYARSVGVDERTVRRWLAGDRQIPEDVRRLACVVIRHPEIVGWLADEAPRG